MADYIEDMVFIPIDENGFALDPPPSPTFQKEKLYKIKTVDVAITVRSTNRFIKGLPKDINKQLVMFKEHQSTKVIQTDFLEI